MMFYKISFSIILVFSICALYSPSSAGAPFTLFPGQRQIFVDDYRIANKEGVVRKANACKKLPSPVLHAEKPWEDDRVYVYGTVLYDAKNDSFTMWYMSSFNLIMAATSKDGIVWDRPGLGIWDYEGSTDNNIVYAMHSPSVVFNPQSSDPDKRYTMIGCIKKPVRGYYAACSSDGLNWKPYLKNPVLDGSDTCTLAFDSCRQEYLAFHKLTHEYRGHRRRLVYLSTSKDVQNWSEPELVMAPDETDDDQTRAEGGICSQFYNISAFQYAGQWLGLITHFRYNGEPKEKGPKQSKYDGPIDVQVVHSRDGREWQRCSDRSPVIPNGPYDYDAGCILGVANSPVIVDNEMWIYYTAITTTHGGYVPEKKITIARAVWRLDGMVSIKADEKGGWIETGTFTTSGDHLIVNADAHQGNLSVAVLDAEGEIIPGYSHKECVPVKSDSVRHHIKWKNNDSLMKGQPIRLRFYLKNAELFSYMTEKDNEGLKP